MSPGAKFILSLSKVEGVAALAAKKFPISLQTIFSIHVAYRYTTYSL